MKWYYELPLVIGGGILVCLLIIEYAIPVIMFCAVFLPWIGEKLREP